MTDLIVALDGPNPLSLAGRLIEESGVRWFKLGPQAMADRSWSTMIAYRKPGLPYAHDVKIFLDLKLADTADTVREAVRRFADAGIAAVSTFTNEATNAALDAGVKIAIWQVHALTDNPVPRASCMVDAPGVICPGSMIEFYVAKRKEWRRLGRMARPVDIVVPGVRLLKPKSMMPKADQAQISTDVFQAPNGHQCVTSPDFARAVGATHAVVGRPIWQSHDPVAAAREFIEALSGKDDPNG